MRTKKEPDFITNTLQEQTSEGKNERIHQDEDNDKEFGGDWVTDKENDAEKLNGQLQILKVIDEGNGLSGDKRKDKSEVKQTDQEALNSNSKLNALSNSDSHSNQDEADSGESKHKENTGNQGDDQNQLVHKGSNVGNTEKRIPGSSLSGNDVDSLYDMISCFANEGKWLFNPKPRNMPWNIIPLDDPSHPNYSSCDVKFSSE